MQNNQDYTLKNARTSWLDERLPIIRILHGALVRFRVPRNLNYFYTFGGILTLMLLSQILTGVVVAMHYVPDINLAFDSRQAFMRDGHFGWLFLPWHAVGASFFFIASYIHVARGLYYGSHKNPREMVWIIGVLIYLVMMAIAFLGYVLVWGMMSTSAAAVITGFFKAIPFIGTWLYETLLGGYSIGQPTLNRFYVLHYLLPFILIVLVFLHIFAIHHVGQNNPTGIEVQSAKETVPFSPFALIKDIFAITIFLLFFAWFLFYMPDYMGAVENYSAGDTLKSTSHIAPEWYFLPFYTMLRSINFSIGPVSASFAGVIIVVASLLVLLFVPWLDRSKIRSARYRPLYKIFFWGFIVDVIMLGYCGSREVSAAILFYSQLGTIYYFVFFCIIMPFLPIVEKTTKLPNTLMGDRLMEDRVKSNMPWWKLW